MPTEDAVPEAGAAAGTGQAANISLTLGTQVAYKLRANTKIPPICCVLTFTSRDVRIMCGCFCLLAKTFFAPERDSG